MEDSTYCSNLVHVILQLHLGALSVLYNEEDISQTRHMSVE